MPDSRYEGQPLKAFADMKRIEILDSLLDKPKYISELADALKMDRTSVAYHLGVLESADLLQSHYEILEEPRSKGKAARVYSVNIDKLRKILNTSPFKDLQEKLR